ncbi:MAG: anthranilate phosphoribosyltransferase [Chloroflexi bacterium]|nr:MAG: anthranilate phosphoribosyltransferase [Chloroflexota bacterium]
MEFRDALTRILSGRDLSRDEAESVMRRVMEGEATPAQLGALLAALSTKGESVDEIAGFAAALRTFAVPVHVSADAIDTCGTGGDAAGTFNISTVSAIVCAAAGAPVAKHGNRAASSACGSADVLEALGVRIDLGPDEVARCVAEVGLGFMFAPRYHPAMKHAIPVRRELGVRTVFNVLGPLSNPARVRRQLLGVATARLGERMARVLGVLGAEHVLVAHGEDGLDEISPCGPTRLYELKDGDLGESVIRPEDVGLRAVRRGDAARNRDIAERVLDGDDGAPRIAVLLNAGAALYVAGKAKDIREGVQVAARAIDSGDARRTLAHFVERSQALAPAAMA